MGTQCVCSASRCPLTTQLASDGGIDLQVDRLQSIAAAVSMQLSQQNAALGHVELCAAERYQSKSAGCCGGGGGGGGGSYGSERSTLRVRGHTPPRDDVDNLSIADTSDAMPSQDARTAASGVKAPAGVSGGEMERLIVLQGFDGRFVLNAALCEVCDQIIYYVRILL